MNLSKGSAVFFDFDGVLVDSTAIKTEAYRELYKWCSPDTVEKIISYHRLHGGISRVDKIIYARRTIIDSPCTDKEIENDVTRYSELVMQKVISARWVPGAEEFVMRWHKKLPLFVISGTPQDEMQKITRQKHMDHYFREILGSPIRKPEHVFSLVQKYELNTTHCFFVGDALTDYHAARETNVPFIGIRSEVDFPENSVVLPDCTRLEETMAAFPPGGRK